MIAVEYGNLSTINEINEVLSKKEINSHESN
jgi:hypothetical protein